MEIHGFLKIIILVFVLVIPISIAYLVYRTLFSGLDSISSSKKTDITPDDSKNTEQSQNRKQSEKGMDG
jgi:Domain of unknown function (DUF4834)